MSTLVRSLEADPRVRRVTSIVSLDPRLTEAQYQLMYASPGQFTDRYASTAVDRLALLAAAAALRQSAPEVAALFARTRLEEGHGAMYGTSRIAPDEARRLIDRALP